MRWLTVSFGGSEEKQNDDYDLFKWKDRHGRKRRKEIFGNSREIILPLVSLLFCHSCFLLFVFVAHFAALMSLHILQFLFTIVSAISFFLEYCAPCRSLTRENERKQAASFSASERI